MTCGDGSFGALGKEHALKTRGFTRVNLQPGHGDWQSSAVPKLVESLLSIDVSAVACGPEHVVVVSGKGDLYAWGRGSEGRLGLGNEEDVCVPTEVKFHVVAITKKRLSRVQIYKRSRSIRKTSTS